MGKIRTMIGVYFGNDKKKNWIGSADNKTMVKLLIEAHMSATGRKKSEYKTFIYTEDDEKLGPPRG